MPKKEGFNKIREAVVQLRTGKPTKQWTRVLDRFNPKKNGHTLATKYLLKRYKLSPWWSQVIVIRYERAKGLRR